MTPGCRHEPPRGGGIDGSLEVMRIERMHPRAFHSHLQGLPALPSDLQITGALHKMGRKPVVFLLVVRTTPRGMSEARHEVLAAAAASAFKHLPNEPVTPNRIFLRERLPVNSVRIETVPQHNHRPTFADAQHVLQPL